MSDVELALVFVAIKETSTPTLAVGMLARYGVNAQYEMIIGITKTLERTTESIVEKPAHAKAPNGARRTGVSIATVYSTIDGLSGLDLSDGLPDECI